MPKSKPVVLDTHVWIWLLEGHQRLADSPALEIILKSADEGGVMIPAIAVWEVAMLERKGRISLSMELHNWVRQGLAVPGYTLQPLTPEISIESCLLPADFHGDPADRMITATARCLKRTLITADKKILAYAETGHLNAIPV
jgi:PIN domain nuclease of toxin-antitoxin system